MPSSASPPEPRPPPEVVTLGETMVLFTPVDPGPMRHAFLWKRYVAGAESNFAIGVARLGHSVGWISRLGDDEFGATIRNFIRGEGVDVSQVRTDPEAPTGCAFKERRELVPGKVVYYRRGSAASRLAPDDLDPDYIGAARWLHVGGITPALSDSCRATVARAIAIARERGVRVSFDPNLRLRLWDIDTARAVLLPLMAQADVLLPGLEEAELLVGEAQAERAAERLLALGPQLVVLKLGAQGSLAAHAGGVVRAPAIPLPRIVDPVGAGDAFAAGFVVAQLEGRPLEESLRIANACGACAMTVEGDVEGLPTWRDLELLVSRRDMQR